MIATLFPFGKRSYRFSKSVAGQMASTSTGISLSDCPILSALIIPCYAMPCHAVTIMLPIGYIIDPEPGCHQFLPTLFTSNSRRGMKCCNWIKCNLTSVKTARIDIRLSMVSIINKYYLQYVYCAVYQYIQYTIKWQAVRYVAEARTMPWPDEC